MPAAAFVHPREADMKKWMIALVLAWMALLLAGCRFQVIERDTVYIQAPTRAPQVTASD